MNPLTPTDDTPDRPHLQCDEGQPPTPADLLWLRRCRELCEVLLAAEERRAA